MNAIRKDLKLTQQDLALLLNVSRSTIAMYEKGLRPIPSKATVAWARLQTLWLQNRQKKQLPRVISNKLLQLQQEDSIEQLNIRLQRAAVSIVYLTQKLSRMENNYERLVQQLQVLKDLMAETRPGTRQMALLKNREQLALLRLTRCCPQRRELLAFQLKVLHAQQKAALAGKVIIQQQG